MCLQIILPQTCFSNNVNKTRVNHQASKTMTFGVADLYFEVLYLSYINYSKSTCSCLHISMLLSKMSKTDLGYKDR